MEFKWKSWSEAGISLFRQAGINVAFGDSEVTVGLGTQPPLHKHKHLESHRTCLKSQCGRVEADEMLHPCSWGTQATLQVFSSLSTATNPTECRDGIHVPAAEHMLQSLAEQGTQKLE